MRKFRKVSIYGNFSWYFILVVFAIFFQPECRAETPKTTIVMAKALDDLMTLDPAEAFEFSSTEILANVYDRLFVANPENPSEPNPGLVNEWTRSLDGLEYQFLIRRDAAFAGGASLRARDVVFSIRRAVILNKTPAFILNQLGLTRANVEKKVRTLSDVRLALEVDRPYSASFVLNISQTISPTFSVSPTSHRYKINPSCLLSTSTVAFVVSNI